MQPRSHYILCDDFNVHYTAWGEPSAPAVIAWHGLARTGRDFDTLAQRLSQHYFVICPDTIGRGLSQWSTAPDRDYCFEVYAAQARALADTLGLEKFAFVGTSSPRSCSTAETNTSSLFW